MIVALGSHYVPLLVVCLIVLCCSSLSCHLLLQFVIVSVQHARALCIVLARSAAMSLDRLIGEREHSLDGLWTW